MSSPSVSCLCIYTKPQRQTAWFHINCSDLFFPCFIKIDTADAASVCSFSKLTGCMETLVKHGKGLNGVLYIPDITKNEPINADMMHCDALRETVCFKVLKQDQNIWKMIFFSPMSWADEKLSRILKWCNFKISNYRWKYFDGGWISLRSKVRRIWRSRSAWVESIELVWASMQKHVGENTAISHHHGNEYEFLKSRLFSFVGW